MWRDGADPRHDSHARVAAAVQGPYAGKLLADLGADVVKADPPNGDVAAGRDLVPASAGHEGPVAIAVETDEQWQALCATTVDPVLGRRSDCDRLAGRETDETVRRDIFDMDDGEITDLVAVDAEIMAG